MADAFFRVFDEDNSGALNFYEFMMAKNASDMKTSEEKLNWIFTAFDQDGGGTIDVEEVYDIVLGLFKMLGKGGEDTEIEEMMCVQKIIQALDTDEDGVITKEEFVQNAMKSNFIMNLVTE